jgi:hypothetical protein
MFDDLMSFLFGGEASLESITTKIEPEAVDLSQPSTFVFDR